MLAVPTLFSADATVATITAVATTFTSSISPPSFNAASLSTAVIAATITLVSATVPAVTPPAYPPYWEVGSQASATIGAVIGPIAGVMGLAVLLLFVYCKYWRPKSRMYISHEHDIDVFVKDNDEPLDLKSVFTVALSGKIKGSVKYTGEVRELISGKPQDAAYGFIHYMKVAPDRVYAGLSKGTAAIRAEFECYRGEEADVYLECLNYVMYEAAGSSPKLFATRPTHATATRMVCDRTGSLRAVRACASPTF